MRSLAPPPLLPPATELERAASAGWHKERDAVHACRGAALLEVNRQFYDHLWTDVRLVEPQRFNTWPLVCSLAASRQPRLEVAPGLRPRLPLDETHFVDISPPAVAKLRARGANAVVALVTALPFPDRA